ncbi:MAG: hypothetical protein EXR92_02095 [Gemmatimonadetes bacterium]|nr:hypothetical protein [Gemmatimonadota bacterium]
MYRKNRIQVRAVAILAGLLLIAACREPEVAIRPPEPTRPPHRYDIEYPVMNYAGAVLTDPIARLQERLKNGQAKLEFDGARGYLTSLLRELGIDPKSQLLVFSRTSGQISYISPETPRAMYYTDDVYVGWPLGAPEIEIGSMDPNVGPVFYTLAQEERAAVHFDRQMDACLGCHDSYSLTGGGVPRFIVGSGPTGRRGEQVTHEGWILVDDRTPLSYRWGGWYVTGTQGAQTHLGNWVIRDPAELMKPDLSRTGNVTELSSLIDTDPYLEGGSDIVALMVIDHQTHLQNLITRVNFDTRTLLAGHARGDRDEELTPELRTEVRVIAEPLVEALFMVDEARLTDQITGTPGFAEEFEARGPHDAQGRTLRELDLSRRLFRYPCSYLIYSDAFDALPTVTRRYVYRRLASVLTGEDRSPTFAHLSQDDRRSVLEILGQTKPEFAALEIP